MKSIVFNFQGFQDRIKKRLSLWQKEDFVGRLQAKDRRWHKLFQNVSSLIFSGSSANRPCMQQKLRRLCGRYALWRNPSKSCESMLELSSFSLATM